MNSTTAAPGQWRRLRSALGQDGDLGIPSVETSVVVPGGPSRLAVGPAGEALLLIPMTAEEPFHEIPASRALGVREAVLSIRGEPRRFLELACLDARLEGVFEQLVEEVLRRLEAGEVTMSAVVGTVDEFRELLGRPGAGITMDRLIGLLGELHVLNELLAMSPTAWRSWTGPSAGRHDFRAGALAIECKTSRRSQGSQVTISAIDQLEPPLGGELILRTLLVEPDAGGELFVKKLADDAIAAASDPAALRALLESAGWSPAATEWMTMRFSVLQSSWHRVEDGFPRLVRSSLIGGALAAGVSGVSYAIQLDLAERFLLDAEEADVVVRTIAHAA